MATRLQTALDLFLRHRGLFVAIAVVSLPMVIIVPMPTPVIDFLLTVNLALAIIILLTTLYIGNPLEFSVFPSLLLVVTLYRLVLNVATTRLILGNAQEGEAAAGQVIRAFGTFVAGNQPLIGFIIFVILVVIQFVVITRGATRISEVAARFTLDAMPGKQMAVDADLNAGLIDEHEARRRREEIGRTADFFGAMDGASKFVRGDAVAGIIITLINILGGFILGWAIYNMTVAQSLVIFTRLTIGDGLVTQIPAFIVSVAAGLVVTRSASKETLGEEMIAQVLTSSHVLAIASGFLVLLAFTGLPMVPMLGLGVSCGLGAWLIRSYNRSREREAAAKKAVADARKIEEVEGLLAVDPMELEIGYGLIRLVDADQNGDLLDRITMLRRQMALEMGVVVPPIRIRDNMQLGANQYVIKIQGNPVARGEVLPERYLAMDPGGGVGRLEGIETTEPAFGIKAYWIDASQRERAQALGFTVVDPTTVLATHLTEVIRNRAPDLLNREDVKSLLDNLRKTNPAVVDEVVPGVLKIGEVQKVLANLLAERVSVRNLARTLEILGDHAALIKSTEVLTEYVRAGLATTICESLAAAGKIHAVTFDPVLEATVSGSLSATEGAAVLAMSPPMMRRVAEAIERGIGALIEKGHAPILLVSASVRPYVRRLAQAVGPHVTVLSYNEIAGGYEVVSHGVVSLEDVSAQA